MPQPPCRFLHSLSAAHKPLVAISACLTGKAVRYDATDKYQPGLEQWLHGQLTLLPICPEVDAGLGVPRPPVQLVDTAGGLRALGRDRDPETNAKLDVTDALATTAAARCATLRNLPLCGYLWKSRSPSCGLGSTPRFDATNHQIGLGHGLQAAAVATTLPWLAMAEEEVLQGEMQARHFLLCCRLVFDVLHAGDCSAAQVIAHYRDLLEGNSLVAAASDNDRHAVATVITGIATRMSLATLIDRLPH